MAASPETRGHGVVVVFHGLIHDAREVAKISTVNADAFGSGSAPAGRVSGAEVTLPVSGSRRHAATSEFDVGRITALARVDVLLTYQGAPGDLVAASLERGARGLVVAAAGAGALSAGEVEAVGAAVRTGVPVVLASRVADGYVSLDGIERAPTLIAGGDLAPVKARILLMLAVSQGLGPREIERVFREY